MKICVNHKNTLCIQFSNKYNPVSRQCFDKTVGFSIAQRISFYFKTQKLSSSNLKMPKIFFKNTINEKKKSSNLVIGSSQYAARYYCNILRVSVS